MNEKTVQKDAGKFNRFRWSLITIFFMVNILLVFTYKNPALLAIDPFLVTALLFIIVVFHGMERYGKKNIAIFFLITGAVTFFFENLSIATGFPFGFYHYSPNLGPLTVPIIIIFAYFAMGYPSWMLAHVLTGQYTEKLRGKKIFIVPLIAAFIMVMWDLTLDPISSTLQGLWIWNYPGAYFGVPLSNFFGWFLTVFIFFQIFAWYLSKYDTITPEKAFKFSDKPYWTEAAAVYGITALGIIFSIFYQYNAITLSMALITVFTMVFVVILALINIINNPDLNCELKDYVERRSHGKGK